MHVSFHASLLLVLAAVSASIALSYYVYRHTVPVVLPWQRRLLTALRASAFTLALLALFEPMLVLTAHEEQRPSLAVLVDASLSMTHTDRSGDRSQQVRTLLRSGAFARLEREAELRLIRFSHDTAPLHPDSLAFTGGATDIAGALQSVLRDPSPSLQGAVLITDGNATAGSNPLYAAERSRLPLFTVGVGDTSEQRDLSLSRLLVNAVGYAGSSIPVDAAVRASGLPASAVTVTLKEEGRTVEQRTVQIPSTTSTPAEVPVQFTYTPSGDGMKKLTVTAAPRQDEVTEKNNARSAMVKVLKSKMKVAVIAGAPSPDAAAVMQSLNSDRDLDVSLFLQSPSGELKERGARPLSAALPETDVLVLVGYPGAATPVSTLQSVAEAVRDRSLPLLFIAGRQTDPQRLKVLETLLPVSVVSARTDEQSVLAAPAARHRTHVLLQPDAARFPSFAWEKLPPVYASFQTYAVKNEAQTLLSVRIQGITLQNPLLAVRSAGRARSAAFTGYGIFRWKTLAAGSDETRGVFDVWLSSVVRWLAVREENRRFSVTPEKESFAQGEPVPFTAQLYNESFEPLENADIELTIRTAGGGPASSVSLRPLGSGRYTGVSPALPQGEYLFTAAALSGGDTAGTAGGRFSVGDQSLEFAETKMNRTLLQQLAERSGGMYADAADFPGLAEAILARDGMSVQERTLVSEHELWRLPWYLAAIVTLFGTEWFLRKRWGML